MLYCAFITDQEENSSAASADHQEQNKESANAAVGEEPGKLLLKIVPFTFILYAILIADHLEVEEIATTAVGEEPIGK